jgi:membrane protein
VVTGIGVIALLWTVVWLIHNIENSFSVVWGLPPRRNVLRKFSNYLSVMLITPIMMVAVSTLGVMIRQRLDEIACSGLSGWPQWLFDSAGNIVPLLANFLLFLFVYMRVPNTKVRLKGACLAAIITGISFQLLQDSFIFLQGKVFSYNRLYGGFAILPLFLIWVNWSWQLILFGAEICFVHQHLKSGIFNEGRRKLSVRLRREHQLAILRLVFQGFESGSGPVAEAEISSRLHVPEVFMRSEIGELIDAGMLCRTVSPQGVAFLLPGIPPDKLTVMDFLKEMGGVGDEESPEFSRFEMLFCKMEKAIEESKLNSKIHEI